MIKARTMLASEFDDVGDQPLLVRSARGGRALRRSIMKRFPAPWPARESCLRQMRRRRRTPWPVDEMMREGRLLGLEGKEPRRSSCSETLRVYRMWRLALKICKQGEGDVKAPICV